MYSLQQIAEITNSLFFGSSDKNITVFLTDSRALQTPNNTLFIALKTNRNNGHNFIVELIDKGVKSFLIQENEFNYLVKSKCQIKYNLTKYYRN